MIGAMPQGGDGQLHKWQVFICPNGKAAPRSLGVAGWKARQLLPHPQPVVLAGGIT